ncbi:hypothetical protein PMAYCL1PPCAC_10285 [Pristionchus mayeri]|uniref:Uncharacterized protein n=1 Tax=Pristionchus mayeri TaxID=1317129 RepID=A0AAN4ZM09_9BILA|nr:hypothetical protein PMAYCL1PPCAC_10285 [Pristionchus mayeri]
MTAKITPAEISTLVNQLSPVLSRVEYDSLVLFPSTSQTFSLISKLFEGKTVPHLTFVLDGSNEKKYLTALIEKLHCDKVKLVVCYTVSNSFLIQLAGKVEQMTIAAVQKNWLEGTDANSVEAFNGVITNLAREIFKCRCSALDLTDAVHEYALDDASLLPFHLNMDIGHKEVYFIAGTSERIAKKNYVIGTKVSTFENPKKAGKYVIEVRDPQYERTWFW